MSCLSENKPAILKRVVNITPKSVFKTIFSNQFWLKLVESVNQNLVRYEESPKNYSPNSEKSKASTESNNCL